MRSNRKCREAQGAVHRLESALRLGDPIPEGAYRSATGALSLARRYLVRLVEPDGEKRVDAAMRALERASELVPSPPPPRPLTPGWHSMVTDDGTVVGYANVQRTWYTLVYDKDLNYIDGMEAPLENEGLGPLDYLPIGVAAGRLGYALARGIAAQIAKKLTVTAIQKTAARSIVIAGTMRGVAQAAPVVAGELAERTFISAELLSASSVKAEASAAARAPAASATTPSAGARAGVTTATRPVTPPVATAGGAATVPGLAGGITATAGALGAEGAGYAASLGEQAEGPNLRAYHPMAISPSAEVPRLRRIRRREL